MVVWVGIGKGYSEVEKSLSALRVPVELDNCLAEMMEYGRQTRREVMGRRVGWRGEKGEGGHRTNVVTGGGLEKEKTVSFVISQDIIS